MDKNQSLLLYFILWTAIGMSALILLAGCSAQATAAARTPQSTAAAVTAGPSGDIQPTNSAKADPASQIEDYIVREIAGSEKEHRYIVRVSASDLRAPLPATKDVIQKCWLYQDGELQECSADSFVNSFSREGAGAWDYSYVVFSIIEVDPGSGRATVRVDELAGPRAGKGLLYTLVQVNDSWQTESSKLLFSS